MTASTVLQVPHVVHGVLRTGAGTEHTTRVGETFAVPELDLDELVLARGTPGPAFETPIAEVLDLLAETGRRLQLATNPHLQESAELMSAVSPHSRRLIEASYRCLPAMFERPGMELMIERELGAGVLDGWTQVSQPNGSTARIRAYPPRLVHVMAGNGPPAAAVSIVRGALTKGVNLLKLPSNDLYTATAILRTMAEVDPEHPTVRSFSAVYWRGGDPAVESTIFRPQYFDKLVAWGGESTIRSAIKYIGPGFELVSFDPKTSISMVGHEAFTSDTTLRRAAADAAVDVAVMNQEACVASRFIFVEGATAEVDRLCEHLSRELALEREWSDAVAWPPPRDIRDQIEVLEMMGSHRIWGRYDGSGLVIRSAQPVDFHPVAKTVNVVPVAKLADAVPMANVATQTVGVYPAARKAELRDGLACVGVQRIVTLGTAIGMTEGFGLPHDGFFPLQRLVRWCSDEDAATAGDAVTTEDAVTTDEEKTG